jgi:DNA-directed RNA polymerase specialized sigma24 family protein
LRIARNLLADFARTPASQSRGLEIQVVSLESIAVAGQPEPSAVNVLDPQRNGLPTTTVTLSHTVQKAIDKLPERQQYILKADAASPDGRIATRQLAEELGINPKLVRALRSRGLTKARTILIGNGLKTGPMEAGGSQSSEDS